jgi:hypothetical protein
MLQGNDLLEIQRMAQSPEVKMYAQQRKKPGRTLARRGKWHN